jgi:hypothetical protein
MLASRLYINNYTYIEDGFGSKQYYNIGACMCGSSKDASAHPRTSIHPPSGSVKNSFG